MTDYPPGSILAMFPKVAQITEGLLAERNALEARIADALALHRPSRSTGWRRVLRQIARDWTAFVGDYCPRCQASYPCATARALGVGATTEAQR